ncbi:MAG: hypothetical protein ACOYM5_09175 [Caulobacter sp.]
MATRPLINDAPPGWTAINQTLEPERTVAGYLARGEEVHGGCRTYGCRRKWWLDEHARAEAVLARLPTSTLERTLKCARLDGCSFELFPPRPGQSIRLADAVGRANARVMIRCTGCDWTRLPPAAAVIDRLKRQRTGGAQTRVHEVTAALRAPCPACKATCWEATLVWLRTDNMIWQAKGEALFDDMKRGGRL